MATLEQYTAALHAFCADLSRKIIGCAEAGDLAAVGQVRDVIHETVANLMLCDYECERVLHRG